MRYGVGFYEVEHDGVRPFRWMETSAVLRLPEGGEGEGLHFSIGNPSLQEQVLTFVGQKEITLCLPVGWSDVYISLEDIDPAPDGEIILSCPHVLDAAGDTRLLSLMLGDVVLGEAPAVESVRLASGFYDEETDGLTTFRWMRPEAEINIRLPMTGEWLLFYIKSPSAWPEELYVSDGGDTKYCIHILPGEWQAVGLPLALLRGTERVLLSSPYTLTVDNDSRSLSFMVADIHVGAPTAYEKNSALMHREVFNNVRPKSYGTLLVCDTSSECNLKCVACVLDKNVRPRGISAKGLEKTITFVNTLLPLASKTQPYITGEPFFRNDIWYFLDKADMLAKNRLFEIEISTNGLLLSGKLQNKLLQSEITSLLITVNAGTAKTYANICGGNFNRLKKNLISLVNNPLRKKKLKISLSFVLMRENMGELPDFIRLAKEVCADAVQIWSLNGLGVGMPDKILPDGRLFYYKQQMPRYYPKLTQSILEQSLLLAAELEVRIGDAPCYRIDVPGEEKDIPYPLPKEQFDLFAQRFDSVSSVFCSKHEPINNRVKQCYFPWIGMIFTPDGDFSPCPHISYKGGIGNILTDGIEGVWNNATMQEIRQQIIDGTVHPMCKNTQCTFVEKTYTLR